MIAPAPYRARVIRSELRTTEDQTQSGLHVVRNVDPSDVKVLRGVVDALGAEVEEQLPGLSVGAVLFYLQAIRLAEYDFVICSWENVVGWEENR